MLTGLSGRGEPRCWQNSTVHPIEEESVENFQDDVHLGSQPMAARCTALMERPQVLRKRRVSRIDVSSHGIMTVPERKEGGSSSGEGSRNILWRERALSGPEERDAENLSGYSKSGASSA